MQVLSLDQAAFKVGVVRRTLERMLAQGTGPTKVQVSERRRGCIPLSGSLWLQLAPTPGARQGRRLTRAAVDGKRQRPQGLCRQSEPKQHNPDRSAQQRRRRPSTRGRAPMTIPTSSLFPHERRRPPGQSVSIRSVCGSCARGCCGSGITFQLNPPVSLPAGRFGGRGFRHKEDLNEHSRQR